MTSTEPLKARLRAIVAAEGVTDGPWNSRGGSGLSIQAEDGWEVAVAKNGTDDMQPNPSASNAHFIAASRTITTALAEVWLEEIEWLEEGDNEVAGFHAFKCRRRLAALVERLRAIVA